MAFQMDPCIIAHADMKVYYAGELEWETKMWKMKDVIQWQHRKVDGREQLRRTLGIMLGWIPLV